MKRKNQKLILEKLGIAALNPMQEEAQLAIHASNEVVLLSPTGTGKTLAFLLPIIAELNPDIQEVQTLILAPSRELAMQIEQVAREMGTGYKINSAYGGRSFNQDRINLKHRPALLIGTPGRIADHLRRGTFDSGDIKTLVLDEFDKSLEVGFEGEMSEIVELLPRVEKKILTSATEGVEIPRFVGVEKPEYINYLGDEIKKLAIRAVISPSKDKLQTLFNTVCHLGNQPGIVFCNFKDSINRVSDFLTENGIPHGCFYGGMEQMKREQALVKFRNGSHQLLLATDLAARGIDIPEIKFIIHYHLPQRLEEFTHRNGRTARMNKEGTAYVLQWEQEMLPEFIEQPQVEDLDMDASVPMASKWSTLYITAGRRDKISKGDIAGLFFKKGLLEKDEIGIIELQQDSAFVAVKRKVVNKVLPLVNNQRVKKTKVRVYEI